MAYERVNWENLPSTKTPVNADNLNKMDARIANAVEKSDLLNLIYPVGSIYMSVNSTNPAILFGGTWEQIKDTFLLACGDTYKNGESGGEATHSLTFDEMPPHFHSCNTYSGSNVDGKQWSFRSINNSVEGGIGPDNAGRGQPHNNMPPYLVVTIWKRIA